jgi:hypothetical protein
LAIVDKTSQINGYKDEALLNADEDALVVSTIMTTAEANKMLTDLQRNLNNLQTAVEISATVVGDAAKNTLLAGTEYVGEVTAAFTEKVADATENLIPQVQRFGVNALQLLAILLGTLGAGAYGIGTMGKALTGDYSEKQGTMGKLASTVNLLAPFVTSTNILLSTVKDIVVTTFVGGDIFILGVEGIGFMESYIGTQFEIAKNINLIMTGGSGECSNTLSIANSAYCTISSTFGKQNADYFVIINGVLILYFAGNKIKGFFKVDSTAAALKAIADKEAIEIAEYEYAERKKQREMPQGAISVVSQSVEPQASTSVVSQTPSKATNKAKSVLDTINDDEFGGGYAKHRTKNASNKNKKKNKTKKPRKTINKNKKSKFNSSQKKNKNKKSKTKKHRKTIRNK